jgi:hypothetical protein
MHGKPLARAEALRRLCGNLVCLSYSLGANSEGVLVRASWHYRTVGLGTL